MKLACLMMQKNEIRLLKPWLDYHALIFGLENMYVYDNGSTEKECIDILKAYEKNGLNVEWMFNSKKDFENKGYIFSERIKSLDSVASPYDFYFPLDCDEFIAYERAPGDLLLDKKIIELELEKYIGTQSVLAINAGYDNNPLFEQHYYRSEGQRKSFFYKGTCLTLDMGFHVGKTKAGLEPQKTKIVYIHNHYKEFSDYQKSAKQKLIGRVSDFSPASLERHRVNRGAGYHLIGALLATEQEYYTSFYNGFILNASKYYQMPFVSSVLKGFGLSQGVPERIKIICSVGNDIRGVIDTISITEKSITITGWALSPNEKENLTLYIFGVNDDFVKISNINRYARPDVVRVIDGAYLNCGISVEQHISPAEFDILKYNEVKVFIKDSSSSSKIMVDNKNVVIS